MLGLRQIRVGPNKIRYRGLLQPILDGLKLFKKLESKNIKIVSYYYFLTAFFMLTISFLLWICYPFRFWLNKSLRFLWILMFIGLIGFFILILGWRSINKFSMLGSLRSISQIISLEVGLIIVWSLIFFIFCKSYLNLKERFFLRIFWNLLFILFLLFLIEIQRTPFDTSEGERELVRGYNTEFRGIFFTFIFLAEYINMLIFSGIIVLIFLSSFNIWWVIIFIVILLIRACYPRLRYDFLIEYAWLKILPLSICLVSIILSFKNF